jgi:hypothetical protein
MSGLSNKDQTLGGILILATSFYTLISKFLILTTPMLPWFQRFIFINFIAKGRGKINLWNQGTPMPDHCGDGKSFKFSEMMSWFLVLG